MDSELLRIAGIFRNKCKYVLFVEYLPTKVRFHLSGNFLFDVFYRSKNRNYSFTLVKDSRIIGWDNSPHHPDLPNFPHHFHSEEGDVYPSSLGGNPKKNIFIVAKEINRFLKKRI
ncbi:MAG TPA: toxin-antitoxin system TumE family protein [Candidatus Brocadiia bacterium]|nr:DUF6516 family protein [Candidatus Brocadiales bacterium]